MDYKNLLDITLELEGLLVIKLNRGEDAPARIDELISEKISSLSSLSADEAIAASVALEETEDAEPFATTDAVEDSERSHPSDESDKTDRSDESDVTDVTDEPRSALPQPPVSINDVTKAFTLNDKFRFRRELFRNSDAELTETLDVLQAMDSIEEAEEYLYNDLAWDPENPEVKDFIGLISPCYTRS